jgi:polyphosphate glucokinase
MLGIDIGGNGIKGALIDTSSGRLVSERYRTPTPHRAQPAAVAESVAKVVQHFAWQRPFGCTFPAIIKEGVARSAANVDKAWIGTDVARLLEAHAGVPATVINDADAAGIAEMRFGMGAEHRGIVVVLTLGTGIGSAMFVNGALLPNSELGHLEIRGKIAENRASDRVRSKKDLSWKKWAARLNEYLRHVERLFSPDLFILSGGVSKKHNKYLHLLDTRAHVVPASLLNNAGIVGAALAAQTVNKG